MNCNHLSLTMSFSSELSHFGMRGNRLIYHTFCPFVVC